MCGGPINQLTNRQTDRLTLESLLLAWLKRTRSGFLIFVVVKQTNKTIREQWIAFFAAFYKLLLTCIHTLELYCISQKLTKKPAKRLIMWASC